jgi:cell volume regulation protein A
MIIMFDGGLHLPIRNLVSTAHYAAILSATGFAVSVVTVVLVAVFLLSWDWSSAILLGIMVGGASSIIVFGLVRSLPLKEETKAMLSLESALTDILATLGAFVMFGIIVGGSLDPEAVTGSALWSVGMGLALGLGAGIPWIFVESKLHNSKHAYMFTLAALFSLFFLARSLGESGALTALVFGLTIGNRTLLAKYLKIDTQKVSTDDRFHDQIIFLTRTFFFIFIGLLATFGKVDYVLAGIGISVLLLLGRVGAARFTFRAGTAVMNGLDRILPANLKVQKVLLTPYDRKITAFMMPRGLAAAVLSTIPLGLGLPNAELYPQIIFMVILGSVVITTVGLTRAAKAQPNQTQPTGQSKS